MTLLLADIASYQGNLTVPQLQAAGFGGINLKISHGLTTRTVHPKILDHIRDALRLDMKISTFHWLTGDASGTAQADYAYKQLSLLGLLGRPIAHAVDVEATPGNVGGEPSRQIYADYAARMERLLGRDIFTYTGAWWWVPRGFAPLTGALWSAPSSGYLTAYPGDQAEAWETGYGGWPALGAMQYGVAPVSGVEVSQTAVRSLDFWAYMTGEKMASWVTIPASDSLTNEFNTAFPARDKASDGSIGDTAHANSSSDHNPDETGATPYEDADSINEVHAKDIDSDLNRAGWSMQRCVNIIVGEHKAGRDNRLQNVIYNRKIASASWGWTWRDYTGPSAHTEHGHFSFRYGSGSGSGNPENDTSPWGILAAIAEEEDLSDADVTAIKAAVKAEVAAAVNALKAEIADVPKDIFGYKYQPNSEVYPNRTFGNFVGDLHPVRDFTAGLGTVAPAQQPKEGSPLNLLAGLGAALDGIGARLGEIEARLDELTPPPSA
jgi:hypothetical protein